MCSFAKIGNFPLVVLDPMKKNDPFPYAYSRKKGHAAAKTDEFLFSQLIPYIGNKRKLLELLQKAILTTHKIPQQSSFLDLFAGSGVVSRMAKKMGFQVTANDWEPYGKALNHALICCNQVPLFEKWGGVENIFKELNHIEPIEDWVTQNLCPQSDDFPDPKTERMFFTRKNGMKIDAIREQIERWRTQGFLSDSEFSFVMAPFLYSICYTSNTSGVFKAYHQGWGGKTQTALYRILSDFRLQPPVLFDNQKNNEVTRMEAMELTESLLAQNKTIDIAYLDPPYNQHPYASNYHILNSMVLWDKPHLEKDLSLRGNKSAIRKDWKTDRKSDYNYDNTASSALQNVLRKLPARHILVSYSTDGTIPLETLLEMAYEVGSVDIVLQEYKRYRVSSQRFSKKPVNIEFVLIIHKGRQQQSKTKQEWVDWVLQKEQNALNAHKETLEENAEKK